MRRQVVEAIGRQRERHKVEKSISAYCSSLSEPELTEQIEWGVFALGEFF
jgi:hypothetical protein